MRIPLSWLAEFVTWSGPAAALAERLTMAGLKIDAIEALGRLGRRVAPGRRAAVEPHPEADRVQVCRVEVGRPAPLVAVSGAPGLATGQLVPVALPGARLPDGREAQAVRIRGVESAGVLCSEAELALGEDASQVLVLPDDAAPGTPLAALPGIADTVLEAEVTPNRGDCLSVLGVAREVAAVSGARLRHPRPRPRESGTAAARAPPRERLLRARERAPHEPAPRPPVAGGVPLRAPGRPRDGARGARRRGGADRAHGRRPGGAGHRGGRPGDEGAGAADHPAPPAARDLAPRRPGRARRDRAQPARARRR